MAIKSKAYNKIKLMFDKKHESSKLPEAKRWELIKEAMQDAYYELHAYRQERKRIAKRDALRLENDKKRQEQGLPPAARTKRKTSLAQWKQMQEQQKQPA